MGRGWFEGDSLSDGVVWETPDSRGVAPREDGTSSSGLGVRDPDPLRFGPVVPSTPKEESPGSGIGPLEWSRRRKSLKSYQENSYGGVNIYSTGHHHLKGLRCTGYWCYNYTQKRNG